MQRKCCGKIESVVEHSLFIFPCTMNQVGMLAWIFGKWYDAYKAF